MIAVTDSVKRSQSNNQLWEKGMGKTMADTKGQEDIRVGKGTCVISWSSMGKEELVCALGTLIDLIEYGDKYRAMPRFVDPEFKRQFESIMKELKRPVKKGLQPQKERRTK